MLSSFTIWVKSSTKANNTNTRIFITDLRKQFKIQEEHEIYSITFNSWFIYFRSLDIIMQKITKTYKLYLPTFKLQISLNKTCQALLNF